jgi:hypothetical protein
LFTLEFEPSLTGGEEPFETECSLRDRLLATLFAFEKLKIGVEILTPLAYEALTTKQPLTFYLVDSDFLPEEENDEIDEDNENDDNEDPPVPIAVTAVLISATTTAVTVNATVNLTATVVPSNAANQSILWSSDNSAVATVNQNGTVTGTGEGTANITATTVDGGYTTLCAVTVCAVHSLWQGSKTVNGITITISDGHVTMNGTKTVADYASGTLYFTYNVTDVANISGCPAWADFSAGDIVTLILSNKTGTCSESGTNLANAACQLRLDTAAVVCGATWGNPTGTFGYTFTAAAGALGLICYLNSGAVLNNYAFDIEFWVNGVRWV